MTRVAGFLIAAPESVALSSRRSTEMVQLSLGAIGQAVDALARGLEEASALDRVLAVALSVVGPLHTIYSAVVIRFGKPSSSATRSSYSFVVRELLDVRLTVVDP